MLNTTVVKAMEERVRETALSCEKFIKTWPYYEKFSLSVIKTDWAKSRRTSRGGKYSAGYGINMAMWPMYYYYGVDFQYQEYPSFDKDPVIGGFLSPAWKGLALEALTIHEVAHAAQYFFIISTKLGGETPHGRLFKANYAKLRTELLNKRIPNGLQIPKKRSAASR